MEIILKAVREVYANYDEENPFFVYACVAEKEYENLVEYNDFNNFTVSGGTELSLNTKHKMNIEIDKKSKYPSSYTGFLVDFKLPETKQEQWDFLELCLTEKQYNHFYDVYYNKIDMIVNKILEDKEAFDISKIKGFGEKNLNALINKIDSKIEIGLAIIELAKYKINETQSRAIMKKYKTLEKSLAVINTNVYQLTEIEGFGFKTVDKIALEMGIEETSEFRIESAISFSLMEFESSGNTKIQQKKLLNLAQPLLDIQIKYIRDIYKKNIKKTLENIKKEKYNTHWMMNNGIIMIDGGISRYSTTKKELEIATSIFVRNQSSNNQVGFENEELIKESISQFEEENGFNISDEQRNFFYQFSKNNVSFLVGNAGSGKSMSQMIMKYYSIILKKSINFLAPTGKASKVLGNYTKTEAYTIHRAMAKGIIDDSNIIFIDEASMSDIELMHELFMTTSIDRKIVFCGDDSQIPSVGAGNFLYDCINNKYQNISKYTKVFRQEEGGILDIVTKTRKGEKFIPSNFFGKKKFGKDLLLDTRWSDDEDFVDRALVSYQKCLDSKRWSIDDIVILVPTNKGKFGTVEINKRIQEMVNPKSTNKEELKSKLFGQDVTYREGDLILIRQNSYNAMVLSKKYEFIGEGDIFNGESGTIVKIDESEKRVIVNIDDQLYQISMTDAKSNLQHGWCITTHKSQGSQYKVGISIVDSSATYQLNANLLYTAWSRIKEYLLILGNPQTINSSLEKFENLKRETNLGLFLDIIFESDEQFNDEDGIINKLDKELFLMDDKLQKKYMFHKISELD